MSSERPATVRGSASRAARPSGGTLLMRGAKLQCAWCGNRPGFRRGWFGRHERCTNCGMSVQRGEQGFELGAATVNAILTLGALVLAGGIVVASEYPDVSTGPLIVVLAIVAVVLPILFYPFTYTLWFAVELLMDPPSNQAVAEAAQAHADSLRSGA